MIFNLIWRLDVKNHLCQSDHYLYVAHATHAFIFSFLYFLSSDPLWPNEKLLVR